MKAVRTWILIANGTQARTVSHIGIGHGFQDIEGMVFTDENAKTGDINSDRPGRTFDSSGSGRHSMEAPTDPQRHKKHNFAGFLAQQVKEKFQQSAFDRLIIAAAPAMLGDIRKALPKEVNSIVSAELAKDLCHIANSELDEHLADVMAV